MAGKEGIPNPVTPAVGTGVTSAIGKDTTSSKGTTSSKCVPCGETLLPANSTITLGTSAMASCQECCNCTPDQLLLEDMWNCRYIKLVETFLNQSYYGDRCLAETAEKLFLYNAMFWLFQTNRGPYHPLSDFAGSGCRRSTLMHTFPSAICTDLVCEMLLKFDDLIGKCCTLAAGIEIPYCERGSRGEWKSQYNNGLGYQLNDIVFFGNTYWTNTLPNNTQAPSNSPLLSGWKPCVTPTLQ